MFRKTKQAELGRFSARWGCYATCILNIMECELGRKLSMTEIQSVFGAWLISEWVYLSNYKDHDIALGGYQEKPGWHQMADPEIHFWVRNQEKAILDAMRSVGVKKLTKRYNILKWDIGHFVLEINGGHVINPDPSLSGKVVDTRPVGALSV